METINVHTLKHNTLRILERVQLGETIEITQQGLPVAQLMPIPATVSLGKHPDFRSRLKAVYGDKVLAESATNLFAKER